MSRIFGDRRLIQDKGVYSRIFDVVAGVGLASQVVHSPTDGFSAGVAVRPWVQFDVSGD